MFSEYNFRNYNFRLLFYVLAPNLVGVVVINSAVGGDRSYVNRQLIGLFGGLMLAIAISLMDYRKLMKCCGLVYIGCVGILLAVIVAGQLGGFGGGSRRWIDLPVIGRFQPSEFVKIGLIFFLLLVPSEEPGEDQPAIGAGDGGSAGGGASGSDLKAAGPVHQHRDRFLYPLPDLYGWDQL